MFESLFRGLKADNNNEPSGFRRKYTRREVDQCVIKIDGKTYPVENWSLGGVLLQADARGFDTNDSVEMTLKFKLSNRIVDIPHTAKIIRKTMNKVALKFDPVPRNIRGQLQSVVDDYVASQFANSQIA